MTGHSRRAFLSARLGRAPEKKQGNTPEAPALRREDKATLPPVISWLSEYIDEAPDPPVRRAPQKTQTVALLRPPGAVAERDFLARCTRCGDCLDRCPHSAIRIAPERFREATGTPYIDARQAPCLVCEDTPCISACKEHALVADGDVMGHAHLSAMDCLNTLGTDCRVCQERCPVEGALVFAASTRTGERRLPEIYNSLCVGCGICSHACPAPQEAISVLPNLERRTPAPTLEENDVSPP